MTDVTASSAILTGSFTYEGEETVGIEVGFAYKPSGETDYATKTVTASSGDKRAAITGLSAATTYNVPSVRLDRRQAVSERGGYFHH